LESELARLLLFYFSYLYLIVNKLIIPSFDFAQTVDCFTVRKTWNLRETLVCRGDDCELFVLYDTIWSRLL